MPFFSSFHLFLHDASLRGDAVVVLVALVARPRAAFHGHVFGHDLEKGNKAPLNFVAIRNVGTKRGKEYKRIRKAAPKSTTTHPTANDKSKCLF